MERWVGKVAVVTGASAGIGAAIAISLAKSGMIVVGLARRKNRIEELKSKVIGASGQIHAYECDVTKPESVQNAFDWIEKTFGGVNVLVNNAGAATTPSILDEGSEVGIKQTIDLNLMGVIYCTKAAYKILVKTGDIGHIVNISSVAGHSIISMDPTSKPMMNVYGASKHALRVTSEVLRQELRFSTNKNIKISQISPGYVKTEFLEASGFPHPEMMAAMPYLIAEDIADACLHVIGTPPRVQIHDVIIKPAGEMFG